MPFSVRRATLGDEPTLRALRLQALSDAPDAFSSTYERELARTTLDWQRWLSPGVTFIVDGSEEPVGLVAGVHDQNDTSIVYLMAMWVHPTLRGSGAADALIASVCLWAAEEGAMVIRLHVAEGNDRARHCYERNAFYPTGQRITGARDGLGEIEMQRLVRP